MKKIRITGVSFAMLLVSLAVCFAVCVGVTTVNAAQSDNWTSNQVQVQGPEVTDENNAYIIFSKEPVKSGMSYIEPNGATISQELYSEQVEFNGVPCRQVYLQNKFYLNLDEDFASEEDKIFSISFDYWDYGGGGYIYLEYYTEGSTDIQTLTILKLGLDEKGNKTEGRWYRVTVCIENLRINSMVNGADFRIRSGAYNAFSKFEVKNLSRMGGNEFLGVYNSPSYEMLQKLGYFPAYEEGFDYNEFYSKQLTREEALVMMMKGLGMEETALTKNLTTSFTDVSAQNAPYVALAESFGVVAGGGALNTEVPFTQKELVQMYLNLLSIDVPEGGDVYAIAREKGLISTGSLIFQPDRAADIDAFSGLCLNALFLTNEKTGFNAFTEGVNNGKYNIGEFVKSGLAPVIEWMKKNTFKLPKNERYDKETGWTYYTVNFFGGHFAKSYYTMNCMSSDNKRMYVRVLEKYIMEYNIETEMCRYIDEYHGSGCLVSPLDNLWWITTDLKIMKMDLDTYEREVVATLPEWQKNAWALQINNDESWLSCWFVTDNSGEIDNKLESRMPRLNLKTGEWDLRYKYGFPETGQGNPNHMCINPNPEYSNLYFFAHEGNNTDIHNGVNTMIPDRTWLLNFDTGEFVNAIKQKWLVTPNSETVKSGIIGKGGCHEWWTYDGEWLCNVSGEYVMSYIPDSIGLNPEVNFVMIRKDLTDQRLIRVNFSTSKAEMAPSMTSNHAMTTYDSRFIASDTQYSSSFLRSDLNIVDAETGETTLLLKTPQKGVDPGHTHPQFSPNDQYIIFGLWSEDMAYAETGWIDVSSITKNPTPGGRVQVSEYCEVLSYDCDEDHAITTVLDDDGNFEYAVVPRDHYMFVDVKKELIESDNTPGQITITYKDDTTLPIRLIYYTWNENAATRDRNVLKTNEIIINRTGTGKAITKTFKFDDICFGNMHYFGTDFKIGAVGAAATILSVEVSTDN